MKAGAKKRHEVARTPRVILGTMTFGKQVDQKQSARMVEAFLARGHVELDTAYSYVDGKTEEILGQILPAVSGRLILATKANPWAGGGLNPESVREQLETSLRRLRREAVDIFYLHAPDLNTPISVTLAACQSLFREGKFKELGLSNYAAWQVADICHICRRESWVCPTVYQGMYNAITRDVERELFPALRAFGLRFYAYNPLAGGLLTGKHTDVHVEPAEGRFSGNPMYLERYWKAVYFGAVQRIREACRDAGLAMTAAALRWAMRHSMMRAELGDGCILGASTLVHLEENLTAVEGDALPPEVTRAFDEAWADARPACPKYFRP